MARSLPTSVQQAATSQQLGAFIKRYPGAIIKHIFGLIAMGIPMLIYGAIVFLFSFQDNTGQFQLLSIIQSQFWVFLFSFLLLVLLPIAFIVSTIHSIACNARKKVYLFQQGIIIKDKGQIQAFPWSQIAEVFQNVTRRYRSFFYSTTYKYTLRREDGYRTELDNEISRIGKLGKAIIQGFTQERLPRVRYSILAGETVTFGPFKVNVQGLGKGRDIIIVQGSDFISWQEVEAIKVQKGEVSIKQVRKRGEMSLSTKQAIKSFIWSSTPVAKIPNFTVFFALSQEMIQHEQSLAQSYDKRK